MTLLGPATRNDLRGIGTIWPFLAVIVVMLAISMNSVIALCATRAYVAGNGIWARAERETSVLLIGYMRTGSGQLLAGVEAQIRIVLGDRAARLELVKPRPDYILARRGLLAGANHPDDVRAMIWLFRTARLFRVGQEPLRIWAEADERFLSYQSLEQAAVEARSQGAPSATELNDWAQRVQAIHEPLARLEQQFAASTEDYARRLSTFLLAFLAISTAILLAAGYAISRRLVQRAAAIADALHSSQSQVFAEQERAAVLLGSISDAVISTDQYGFIDFLNAAAQRLTGWSAAEAQGRHLGEVLQIVPSGGMDAGQIRQAIDRVLSAGQIGRLSMYGAQLKRRDHSTVSIGERAAPLHNRSGEIVGMVLVMRDVTPERQLWEELRHRAEHDALTGLPNRTQFERQLELSMHSSVDARSRFTLMYIDLDEFKAVNDNCGHHAGDELIRRIATRIQEELRPSDLLARLGGDEFGLLLPACDISMASHISERVRRAVQELQFIWNGRAFFVQASIGVVLDERAFTNVGEVLGAADRACYAAKKAGRNCVRVYSADEDSNRWRAIYRDLSA